MFRPILPARLAVPPPAGRHQPHQESEGEGQGGELQRQVETQEEEPITQLRVSEAPPSAPVPRVDVGAGARDLHSPLLLGEWRPAARLVLMLVSDCNNGEKYICMLLSPSKTNNNAKNVTSKLSLLPDISWF